MDVMDHGEQGLLSCLKLAGTAKSCAQFDKGAGIVLHQLSSTTLETIGPSSVPVLLEALASALEAANNLIQLHQEEQASAMQATVNLLVGLTSWLAQEREPLQQMQPCLVCSPVTKVVDRVLLLGEAAMFSLTWYQALGCQLFQSLSAAMRNVVKDLAAVAFGLLSIWSDLEATERDKADEQFHLCKVFASTLAKRLLQLGVSAADAVLSSAHQSELPKEMVSLASVNVAWGALVKVLTGLPASLQLPLTDADLAVQVIDHNLEYLAGWLEHFVNPPHDANKLKVLRFWVMHLVKLVGTHVVCASRCWPKLVNVSLSVYTFLAKSQAASPVEGSDCMERIVADLEQHVAPKLLQLVMMCLEEEAQDGGAAGAGLEAVMHKVRYLITARQDTAQQQQQHQHQQQGSSALASLPDGASGSAWEQGRLLLATSMLSRAPLLSSSIGLLALARQLLPWAFCAAAVDSYPLACGRHGGGGGSSADGPMGLAATGAVALTYACSSFACSHEDPLAQEAWGECLSQLCIMGCSAHPGLQHLASTTLSCIMASSAPAAATQLLVQLGRAAMDFAAAEAVAEVEAWVSWSAGGTGGGDGGGGSDRASNSVFVMGVDANTASAACRASHLLKCLLQFAPESASGAAYRELRLEAAHLHSGTSDLTSALGTALLTASFAAAGRPGGGSEASAWLTGLTRRVSQLHDLALRGRTCEEAAVASLCLAAVLMAVDCNVKHALQEGQQGMDSTGAQVAQAAAAAAEVLQSWASHLPPAVANAPSVAPRRPGGPPPPPGAHPPAHAIWALRIVARAGASLSEQALSGVLPALTALAAAADRAPSCAAPDVAAAAAHYHCVEPLPVALFHMLLHKRHCALQHEALVALVHVSKSSKADFRALIPKDLFAPAEAAGNQTQVFSLGKAFRAYLERQPSPELREAALLHPGREAEGRALQGLVASGQQRPCSAANSLPARLHGGFHALGACASAAPVAAATAAPAGGGPPPPLLAQLLAEGKAHLAAVAQSIGALDSSLRNLQQGLVRGAVAADSGEGRTQLQLFQKYLLAELASAGSKARSLQDVVHSLC